MIKRVLLALFLIACILPTPVQAQVNWTKAGNKVFINDSNVYLSASPHTLGSSGWVEFELLSKKYAGEIDAVWGFNSSQGVKASQPQIWSDNVPHERYNLVEQDADTSILLENVTSYTVLTPGSIEPDIGNTNNAKLISLTINDPEWQSPLIVAYNSVEQHSSTSATFYYTYTETVREYYTEWYPDWRKFNASISTVYRNYQGCDKWQIAKLDASIQKNVKYKVRCWVEIPFSGHQRFTGKYLWAVKPSGESFVQAEENGHLYLLDPWWDTQWLYRRVLTYDNSASTENLTSWPVVASLNGTEFDFGKFQADGDDARFRNLSDNVAFDYYAEAWDYAAEKAIFIFEDTQIDALSTTDGCLMYYGNPLAANAENSVGVYTADVKLASTYKDSTAATLEDATSNGNDGGITGATWADLSSKLSYLDFDGINDYVAFGSVASLRIAGDLTLMTWIYPDSTVLGDIFSQALAGEIEARNDLYHIWLNAGQVTYKHEHGAGIDDTFTTTLCPITASVWQMLVVARDAITNTDVIFYYNGAAKETYDYVNNPTGGATGVLNLGVNAGLAADYDGYGILYRIINATLSAEQIENRYIQERHLFGIPGYFITFGAEEGYPLAPTNFTGTVSNNNILLSWIMGTRADNTTIVRGENTYPTSIADGTVVYTGNLTSFTDSGAGSEITTYYYSAWSRSEWGYSDDYANAMTGGQGMLTLAFLFLAVGLTSATFIFKKQALGFGAVAGWLLVSMWGFTSSTGTWDIYYGLGWFAMALVIAMALETMGLKEKKEPEPAGDDIDNYIKNQEEYTEEQNRFKKAIQPNRRRHKPSLYERTGRIH